MLENLRLVVMGHDPVAGGTRLIPVENTNLLHNALIHVSDNPPGEVLQIHGDRAAVKMSHGEFRELMPKEPVELATALKAPEHVVEALKTAAAIKDKLMVHAGETGKNEGGLEVLDRVLESHRTVLAQQAQPDPATEQPKSDGPPAMPVMPKAEQPPEQPQTEGAAIADNSTATVK
jgi:hypothetical protein